MTTRPSRRTVECVCGKIGHPDEASAIRQARSLIRRTGVKLEDVDVYECTRREGTWHVTTHPKPTAQRLQRLARELRIGRTL
jgi:hypothetical protein